MFVGRVAELQELNELQQNNVANLVVVQGRRRIGKSRLIEEFAKNHSFCSLAGIAPTKETTAQMQRDEFSRQLAEQLNFPPFIMSDWGIYLHFSLNKPARDESLFCLMRFHGWEI